MGELYKLTHLNLAETLISTKQIQALFNVLPKSLKTLILANNPLKATPQFTNDFTQYLLGNE